MSKLYLCKWAYSVVTSIGWLSVKLRDLQKGMQLNFWVRDKYWAIVKGRYTTFTSQAIVRNISNQLVVAVSWTLLETKGTWLFLVCSYLL
jgi:hypothetical protein